MPESVPAMSEDRGREVLSRIQALIASNVHPSVRDAGLTEAEARWLVSIGLLSLVDAQPWSKSAQDTTEYVDRYDIFELPGAAVVWLAAKPTPPEPIIVRIESPKVSRFSKIFRWLAKTLWGWISAAILTAILFFVGYYLKTHWK